MTKKIIFLALCSLLLAPCLPTQAQQPAKVPRVGLLIPGSLSAFTSRAEAFRQGLRELGYREGQNIVIESRYGEGKPDRFVELAAELVTLKVDVIVTASAAAVWAAKKASTTIPIVFTAVGDPVAVGIVASFARPGGNITGITNVSPDLDGKRLELLKETFPKVSRVGYLWNPDALATGLRGMQAAALELSVQLQSLGARTPNDLESAFEVALKERVQALITLQSPFFITHHRLIVEFATKNRLPATFPTSDYVDAGGLMSYGVELAVNFRRATYFVDRILKGAKPADLPVEQPTKFELVINLKAAKQIGVTVPPNVLARADKVIR